MKKRMLCLLLAVLCLSGCGQPPPARAADGADWDGSWVTVGNVVGVDAPAGLELRENNDALAANGMYYAAWSIGEETPFVNAEGDDAKLYDAQIYLLLAGYGQAEKAEDRAAELLDMAAAQYTVEDTMEAVHNGQRFTIMTYTYHTETNPYQRGASAFGVYRNYAVSVEISCREDFDGDAPAILGDFLDRCHYSV